MDKKIKRNIKLDYISTFITNLNMQSSIWVLYLAYCGMNLMQIGLLEGIYHATSIVCEIPSGALADLVGRKKSMILGRICVTISCIIMLFTRNFWWFAFSFFLQALGNNFNSGSEEALVYDSMICLGEEENYIRINGRINTVIEVSQAIATVVGGVMAEYSYFVCYAACTVISLLAFVPVVLMKEPPVLKTPEEKERLTARQLVARHFQTSFGILASDLRILKIVTYFSVIFAAHTLLFFYSQQYYYDMGYNKIQISVIMLLAGIVSCFGAIASEKLYRRFEKKVLVFSAAVMALTLVFYSVGKPLLSVGMFIAANFFNAVLYPIESETLNSIIPSEQRATLISVNSMFFSIVMIVTFPVAGALADAWSLASVLGVLGLLLLLFIFVWDVKISRKNGR
ncbi:MAG: MFS transporter [Roseburia sp.]|nr:MFS transporter [Roseburia sp.]